MENRLTLKDIHVGSRYEHILNGDYVLAINIGNEQVEIRTKNFQNLYVYPWELQEIDDHRGGGYNNGPRNNYNDGPRNGGGYYNNNGPRNGGRRW